MSARPRVVHFVTRGCPTTVRDRVGTLFAGLPR